MIKRIVVTSGEPAGIGPDILIQLAQKDWPSEIIAIADANLLLARAKQLNLPLKLNDLGTTARTHQPGELSIIHCELSEQASPGKLTTANANYVIQTLKTAADFCLQNKNSALVTCPAQKNIINDAGIPFSGHTEFFADYCHVPKTVMLFVTDHMKVALATTHLALKNVPQAITKSSLNETLSVLIRGLRHHFRIENPHILVCGLNPHAGEGGYLGNEEIEVITPVIDELNTDGFQITGPFPADTLFTPQHLQQADAILGMYHDQVLPLVKYASFGHAVNMTLGLPFLRTSVDHGTALSLAGSGAADAGSLFAATKLAIELINK